MTLGFSTESDIGTFVQAIYEDAMFVARDNNVMRGLVTNFTDRTGLATRVSSKYGEATVNDIAETDDLAPQAFTPTVDQTLTPSEVGAQFFITDSRFESDPFSVRQDAAQELGMAIASKIETSMVGLFDNLTTGTVGAAGSLLTWAYFYAMLTNLRAAKAPMPYSFVCHPYQWYQLGKAVAAGATVTNNPALQNAVGGQFYVGSVSGVNIYTTANITSGSSCYTGMFSPQAMALDMRRAPRLEWERDASRRGWELNLSSVYAYGVWRPEFGIAGLFTGTAVTGL